MQRVAHHTEKGAHGSKTEQCKWWERETWKPSVPKHIAFPLPGLCDAPHHGGLPHRPTNHSTGLRCHPCLHNAWARYVIAASVPSHKHAQSESPSRSLPFIQVDVESIASLLLALPSSFVLSESQNKLRHLNFNLTA